MRAGIELKILTVFAATAVAYPAWAAGFFIQEQSVSAGEAAYSGAATNIKDASTIFFNPAGMTRLDRMQGNLGGQLLVPSSGLDNRGSTSASVTAIDVLTGTPVTATGAASGGDGGNPYSPTLVPSGYFASPVSAVPNLWAGIGVSNPFGLGNKYDSDYFARFDSIKTDLTVTDIQPSFAYQISDVFSFGGGLNFAYANAELTAAVSNGASKGLSKLKGDDWGYGYTFGAQIRPDTVTVIGLNYRSSLHFDLDGSTSVSGLGGTVPGTLGAGGPVVVPGIALPAPNGVTDAKASLTTPDIASIGISRQLSDRWTIMGQANWFGWNHFDNITAIADSGTPISRVDQNYQTSWSYALGAEYVLSSDWTFRAGMQYDQTPTTDEFRTTRTPDGDRTWVSAGATYNLTKDISLDGLVTYIHIQDQEIDVTRGTGVVTQNINADTNGSVGIVGLALNYKF